MCGLLNLTPQSPLVLCDICHMAQHLGCIGNGRTKINDLPAGDWHCSRCEERKEIVAKRIADMEAKKVCSGCNAVIACLYCTG